MDLRAADSPVPTARPAAPWQWLGHRSPGYCRWRRRGELILPRGLRTARPKSAVQKPRDRMIGIVGATVWTRCSPATPPDVRVRIRRFGRLRSSGKAWKSEAVEFTGRQGEIRAPGDERSSTSVGHGLRQTRRKLRGSVDQSDCQVVLYRSYSKQGPIRRAPAGSANDDQALPSRLSAGRGRPR
jgi:hypothetical protein